MSANMVTVDIRGADTASRIIKEFEFKIRRRIVTAAVRAGCNEIKKAAKSRAPVVTGTLKRQITVRSVKMIGVSGKIIGKVGPKRTKAQSKKGLGHSGRYLHLVVGGTRPHEIEPSKKNALAIGGQPYTRVDHPGARPQPFMDAAARSAMPLAIVSFTNKLDVGILKEAAKLRASQPKPSKTR